jgi:hypothetical protein
MVVDMVVEAESLVAVTSDLVVEIVVVVLGDHNSYP